MNIKILFRLVNRELVRIGDTGAGAESGDLYPCVEEAAPAPISLTDSQHPLAYSRPKTTYATIPKQHLKNQISRSKVVETPPDNPLFYTVISSTTTTPRPTFQMDEEQRVLPSISNEEFMEFEALEEEDDGWIAVSTLSPPQPTPPKSTVVIWKTDESSSLIEPIHSTSSSKIHPKIEIPKVTKRPDITVVDKLPDSTRAEIRITEGDLKLGETAESPEITDRDRILKEKEEEDPKTTNLDRHLDNTVVDTLLSNILCLDPHSSNSSADRPIFNSFACR